MYIQYLNITSDIQAEDLIKQIVAEKQEAQRLTDVCEQEISKYQMLIAGYKEAFANSTKDAVAMLGEYCKEKANHKTKTLTAYKLPSGTLQWKNPGAKPVVENDKLLEFIKTNFANPEKYIKTTAVPEWGEIKRLSKVVAQKRYLTDEEGEVLADDLGEPLFEEYPVYFINTIDGEKPIEGVTLVEQPDTFEIK